MAIGTSDGKAYEDETSQMMDLPMVAENHPIYKGQEVGNYEKKEEKPEVPSWSDQLFGHEYNLQQMGSNWRAAEEFNKDPIKYMKDRIFSKEQEQRTIQNATEVDPTIMMFGGKKGKWTPEEHQALEDFLGHIAKGSTKEEAFAKTGWYMDDDGHLKRVIKTDNESLNLNLEHKGNDIYVAPKDTYTLGDIYKNPDLYRVYPELANVKVKLRKDDVGLARISSNKMEVGTMYGHQQTLNVIRHEIQHFIQDKEGFPAGGSMKQSMDEYLNTWGEVEARNAEYYGQFKDSMKDEWQQKGITPAFQSQVQGSLDKRVYNPRGNEPKQEWPSRSKKEDTGLIEQTLKSEDIERLPSYLRERLKDANERHSEAFTNKNDKEYARTGSELDSLLKEVDAWYKENNVPRDLDKYASTPKSKAKGREGEAIKDEDRKQRLDKKEIRRNFTKQQADVAKEIAEEPELPKGGLPINSQRFLNSIAGRPDEVKLLEERASRIKENLNVFNSIVDKQVGYKGVKFPSNPELDEINKRLKALK